MAVKHHATKFPMLGLRYHAQWPPHPPEPSRRVPRAEAQTGVGRAEYLLWASEVEKCLRNASGGKIVRFGQLYRTDWADWHRWYLEGLHAMAAANIALRRERGDNRGVLPPVERVAAPSDWQDCAACAGTGELPTGERCLRCKGSGAVVRKRL